MKDKIKELSHFSVYCAVVFTFIGGGFKQGLFIALLSIFLFALLILLVILSFIFVEKVVLFVYEKKIKEVLKLINQEGRKTDTK